LFFLVFFVFLWPISFYFRIFLVLVARILSCTILKLLQRIRKAAFLVLFDFLFARITSLWKSFVSGRIASFHQMILSCCLLPLVHPSYWYSLNYTHSSYLVSPSALFGFYLYFRFSFRRLHLKSLLLELYRSLHPVFFAFRFLFGPSPGLIGFFPLELFLCKREFDQSAWYEAEAFGQEQLQFSCWRCLHGHLIS